MEATTQINKKTHKNKVLILTWIDLFLFILCWIFTGVIIHLVYFEAMPTSFFYSGLSEEAIANGEGRILIEYYTFGIILASSIITHFVISGIVIHFLIKTHEIMNEQNQIVKHLLWKKVFFWSMLVLYLVMPVGFYFYFHKKGYFKAQKNDNFLKANLNNKQNRRSLLVLISIGLVVIANGIFIGLPTTVPLLIQTASYYNPNNVQKFYTFSNDSNHENVLYLYFDRTDSWRVKKIAESTPEFIDKNGDSYFKDFTFYSNNLSLSDTTISSLPSMTFGWNADVLDKDVDTTPIKEVTVKSLYDNTPVIFPGSEGVNVNDLTVEQYYEYSFANFIAFWNYLGYKITNVCEFPYYGKESILVFRLNNSRQMNDELRNKFGFSGFTGVNANELQRYNNRKVTQTSVDDAETISNLPENLNFTHTDSNVLTAIYSQQIHWNVAAKVVPNSKQYHIINGNYPIYVEQSIKDALEDILVLINKLKNTPVVSENGTAIPIENDSVYNHTTIVITSDHGQCYDDEPKDPLPNDPNSNNKAAGYDPVFMIKPAKINNSSINAEGGKGQLTTNSDWITNADQLALIRKAIFPQLSDSALKIDPLDPAQRYDNSLTSDIVRKFHNKYRNFVTENADDLWNRTNIDASSGSPLQVMRPADWRYLWWWKDIKSFEVRNFSYDPKITGADYRSIFNENYWSKQKN